MSLTRLNDIYRGDDKAYTIHFKDQDSVDVDITGWTIRFTLKKNIDNSDEDAKIKKDITTHTDPTHGKTLLILSNTDTNLTPGKYYYDIQVEDAAGHITTLIRKTLVIRKEITRRP